MEKAMYKRSKLFIPNTIIGRWYLTMIFIITKTTFKITVQKVPI